MRAASVLKNRGSVFVVACASAALAGCSGEAGSNAEPASGQQGTGSADVPPAWLLDRVPDSFADVGDVKSYAEEGDEVAIRGRIGGRVDAMSDEAAFFVMMDPSIPDCSAKDDDHCPTPWDYCCEPSSSKAANSATVQLLGDDGLPMGVNLREHGFDELDTVIVVGTVGPRSSEEVFTIDATGIYLETQ